MTAKTDIFEGLHVLLVTEDDVRAQALAKALRDRKANIGDAKAGAKDPVALRGVDLLLVDTRSEAATKTRVQEMRADVRARWGSVASIDFAKLVLDDGAIYLSPLEEAVSPLVAADRALSERARKEGVFETTLAPLGPSRLLRSLALAGSTLHVKLTHGDLVATVDLSNELLVCAFIERGNEKYEAWAALARILGMSDAKVRVEKRAHPPAMNVMEPINQALEVAAQERSSSAALIAFEERNAPLVEKKAEPFMPARPQEPKGAVNAKRTLLGVIAPGLPASGPGKPPPATVQDVQPAPPAPVAAPERAKPAQRTLLGISPGALSQGGKSPEPVLPNEPANDVVPRPKSAPGLEPVLGKGQNAAPARPKSRPELEKVSAEPEPAPLPANSAASQLGMASDEDLPRAKSTGELGSFGSRGFSPSRSKSKPKLDPVLAQPPPSRPKSRPELSPIELPPENEKVARSPAVTFGDEITGQSAQLLDRQTFGDRPTDPSRLASPERASPPEPGMLKPPPPPPPPPPAIEPEKPANANASSNQTKLDELRELVDEPSPPPPAPRFSLMSAIAEEVPEGSNVDGSEELVEARRKQREQAIIQQRREKRRSRAIALFGLFLFAVGEYYAVRWFDNKSEHFEKERALEVAAGHNQTPAGGEAATPQGASAATPSPASNTPSAPVAAVPAVPPAPANPAAPAQPAASAEPPSAPAQPEPDVAAAAAAAAPAPAEAPAQEPSNDTAPTAQVSDSGDQLVRSANALLAAGNAAGAKETFERALGIDDDNPHAHAGLSEALLKLGEREAALTSIREAVKLRPRRARYRVQLGDALRAQGKSDEARDAYEKALELDPADREAKQRLGL